MIRAPRTVLTLARAPRAQNQDQSIATVLNETYTKYQNLQEGKNADYIPALAKVDPKIFGIAVISPPLDEAGNSVRAQKAISEIVARLHANPYAVEPKS